MKLAIALPIAVAALCFVSLAGAVRNLVPVPHSASDAANIATLPLASRGTRPITVMVQLKGDPVTVVDASSASGLTAAQKQALKDQLQAQQAPVAQQIKALGGTVEGSYQLVYNGIRTKIAAAKTALLASIAGVIGVHAMRPVYPDNIHGVPLIGATQAWDGLAGFHGEHIRIADIDSGIDYTHADFGGSGNPADYQTALASDTLPADPLFFGPSAPKVKGGIDLVGDAYNADDPAHDTPVPDPNPLDCHGHGTHTAGTMAGFGVLANGSTYTGPYDASTIASHSWNVGPGVAPKADLYAVRVFGCTGSTSVDVDAMEWAVANGMDVINMSFGSVLGAADDPDAVAATNAANDGVIVVASSGNGGGAPYVTGTPASGTGAISVSASDPIQSYPGANVALSTGTTLKAQESNGVSVAGVTLPVKVLFSSPGVVSVGCVPADYSGGAGKLVVVMRGDCPRVAKAIYGQRAGAAAVLMINSADSYPPFEGPIRFDLTIPFLGVPSSSASALVAADGGTAALSDTTLANPDYLRVADFSSSGPRSGDSALKPEVTAPGVSIVSAGMATGTLGVDMSGTSMSAPHVTGEAALVRQAHPGWKKVAYWKAAITNTADPSLAADYSMRIAGGGLVQAQPAVKTQVVALGPKGVPALNFGFAELGSDFSQSRDVTLENLGDSAATFTVGTAFDAGSPHRVALGASSVTVPVGGSADVAVTLNVPASTAATSSSFDDVSGLVTFTPTGGSNNGVALRVPYYLVPQAVSRIATQVAASALKTGSAAATTTNAGVVSGFADWYAWGLSDPKENGDSSDLLAVGAQAFPGFVAFAVSTAGRWSNPDRGAFEVYVDVNGDGTFDYVVVGIDIGLVMGGSNGQMGTFVVDLRTNVQSLRYLADAPLDSSTLVLPVSIDQLCQPGSPCLSADNPRLTYAAVSFGIFDGSADIVGTWDNPSLAGFDAFAPAVSTGMFDSIAPGGGATETLSVNAAEQRLTPALGWMVVSHDNRASDEAQLIPLK